MYEEWSDSRKKNTPFVLAINAAVLFSLADQHSEFPPLVSASEQMVNAVVYNGSIELEPSDVVVFDLSRREVLSRDIVKEAIAKITNNDFYSECDHCPSKAYCPVHPNRKLMNIPLFQDRLGELFARVVLKGQHVSLRELLSFLSFILFGDRTCTQLISTAGSDQYSLLSLIYCGGKGQVFEVVRTSFDPAKVTHPVWDERLLTSQVSENWATDYYNTSESIDSNNIHQFDLRKRQFFFFNTDGGALLDISDDDASVFKRFLENEHRTCIKELISKLNSFFGIKRTKSEFLVWNGHRFNNGPRKVLISSAKLKIADLMIGRPSLLPTMKDGLDFQANYIRLQRRDDPTIYLRIDLEMYQLFIEADRGVPMLFIENEVTKRVWRFVEQLQTILSDEEYVITLLDIDDKKEISVTIDVEEKRYISIEQTRVLL